MKLFIDTNIFIEYFERRLQFDSVRLLFNALEDGIHTGYISVGSFYTIAYIVDQGFKRKGFNKQERVDFVRSVLSQILDFTTVVGIDNETLRHSVNNLSFVDLEDSFQKNLDVLTTQMLSPAFLNSIRAEEVLIYASH